LSQAELGGFIVAVGVAALLTVPRGPDLPS